MTRKPIYADNAATTPVSESVLNAMLPYYKEFYGNPSAIYKTGREAHQAIENARKKIADIIGAGPMDIYFTSCGTEADNWALKGTARKLRASEGKKHIITTKIEHHAILHSCEALEREGFEITYLPVDEKGRVTAQQVKEAIRPDTALVSVMYANNEIGTIEPIAEIGKVCREAGVLFHTDAVQAAGILPINVEEDCIDMMSVSAHKFNGPKGTGFLYCRRNLHPETFMDGGAQERGHRAGTENVAGIVGMAQAFEDAAAGKAEWAEHERKLRDYIQKGLEEIPDSQVNGDQDNRLPGTLNMSFPGVDGQSLLFSLDLKGVEASSGSACASGSLDPSHVLMAIGLPYTMAHGSLRITVGRYNTMEDAEYIIKAVKEVVAELRG
ncbi:MAG: cysteine desulfurase family protein [Anaerovoracaceae bacterium]|jgi:cysteine desulfurase|nr:cysteine desulfurase family protein [Bacillota bacterium]MDY2670378.1 cysteine desulfurase family protein [Anaerovoracaceae bacterium]